MQASTDICSVKPKQSKVASTGREDWSGVSESMRLTRSQSLKLGEEGAHGRVARHGDSES